MLALTLDHRRALRVLAHTIRPIVRIGAEGLSENVIHELDQGLKSHELIKVRVFSDGREIRNALLQEMCHRLEAAPVQHIGKILVIYRPKPDEIAKPATAAFRKKRESRRTKRSFQA
ncbi:putative YhbY family RNA-binding protein [Nitrosospira sp. Nsp5]|uniref:RNA-binding protein, YhbY family n=1 Tax=Nitrosospira multiformis TaxID=1231 RepID=A0ABY0TDZ9_9PROT|nr:MULTISPECIES: ribosome assembly RNA-binding protein YhbY [Nitrosospira]PTR07976.1 putative YhbY family RNA-binding protein [Nitrosospira sp. Nsp5]SDQ45793.1 putative RNA-binding protein, YhbY family [Nitrosospira multiformis]